MTLKLDVLNLNGPDGSIEKLTNLIYHRLKSDLTPEVDSLEVRVISDLIPMSVFNSKPMRVKIRGGVYIVTFKALVPSIPNKAIARVTYIKSIR